MDWGVGEGESLSVFDHLTGKNTIHQLIHGKSYESKYKDIGTGLGMSHNSAKASLMKALASIQKGYGGANEAIQLGGSVATKQILDREKKYLGANKQSLVSRGLYGSTALEASERGIASDTSDALATLNAQLAQLGSNVKIGEARDLAGVYGSLAQEDSSYSQMLLQLGLNTEYGEQGGMGAAIGGIIGMFSDRRLKANIEMVGIADGIPIYEYDFVPEAKIEGRWRGVLADEVEHLDGVVFVGDDGYKRVNYGRLGFEMRRIR